MKYRKLDTTGDYVLGTGADFHINTADAVAQAVQTRLMLFTGEWFLDLLEGTPWRTEILGKFTQKTYDTVIKQRILGTPGVNTIVDYQSTYDGEKRTLAIRATIDTIYGNTTIPSPAGQTLDVDFILDLSILG